CQQGDNSPYSF
nr:immunoglobulin light chain junction region [Macaca mulatta]